MKKVVLLLVIVGFISMFSLVACFAVDDVEKQLKAQMPVLQIDGISKTDMDGIYEVITGNNIFYYHPKTGNLIFGEVWSKAGKSITGDRRTELMKKKAETIAQHFDKAVKIGKGKHVVVEFTDPDCPFCRKGHEYFDKREDVSKMIFFFPLDNIHPDAKNKAKYILCSPDREKAYKEVMSGKLDNKKYEVCDNKDVDELLALHRELAMKIGVNGTPAYIINGEIVFGADIQRIEQLIGKP